MADTGTTVHYLTLGSQCDNKQQAPHPLLVQIPNGEIIVSTHTALLSHQDLTIQAQKAHLFPGLNKTLLFIGTLYYHECEATFNYKSVLIQKKWSGKVIIKGTRDPRTNLHMINLTQQNKLITDSMTPGEYVSGSVY